MSVTAEGPAPRLVSTPRAVLIAALAVALVALALVAIALLASTISPSPPPARPIRHPFGPGGEASAPAIGGLFGWLIAMQSDFFRELTAALRAMKDSGATARLLLWLSFAYGVFHAAGPGHGKAVIAGYIVASERALKRGIGLSFAAALLQALVAVSIVAIFSVLLGATAARMRNVERIIETFSYAAVAALGLALLWRKARRFEMLAAPSELKSVGRDGHWHLPAAEAVERIGSWRELAGIVVAAGLRPCSGAIVVLVFAWTQGLLGAGILAVLAMALGTALTTSALAVLSVLAKKTALAIASGRGRTSLLVGAGLETLAAAFVLLLGLGLSMNYWFTTGGG